MRQGLEIQLHVEMWSIYPSQKYLSSISYLKKINKTQVLPFGKINYVKRYIHDK